MTKSPLRSATLLVLALVTMTRPVMAQELIASAAGTTASSLSATGAATSTTTAPEPEDAADAPGRDWFGQRPWGQWTTATGDWNGIRSGLRDAGIDVGITAKMDTSVAAPMPSTARGLITTTIAVDTNKLIGTRGGSLFASLQGLRGDNVSELLGVTQSVSNIDAGLIPAVSEIWYEQRFGSHVRAKAGRIDANTEFAFVEVAGDFLSASMGFSPSITLMPTYPAPPGAVMMAVEGGGIDVRGGMFDGTAGDGDWFTWDSRFAIAQVGKSWERGGAGRIAVGGWQYRPTVDNGSGTDGLFATLEQTFQIGGQDAGAFFQAGSSDPMSPIQRHAGAGLTLAGIVPGRGGDTTGFGATWIRFSPDVDSPSELVFELFHRVALTKSFGLVPDLQWVVRPGYGTASDRTVVFTVRMHIEM